MSKGTINGAARADALHETVPKFACLRRHLTPELYVHLRNYARKRSRMLRRVGVAINSDHADEQVANAIADTASGLLTWHPERCRLETHLCQAIKSRTHKEMRRQRTIRHIRLHTDDAWEHHGIYHPHKDPLAAKQHLDQTLTHLTRKSKDDPAALAIIAAWRTGHTKRSDLIAATNLTGPTYDAARKRLTRRLPASDASKHSSGVYVDPR